MHRISLMIAILAAFTANAVAGSNFSADVVKILDQAREAARELKSISYDGSLAGEGKLAGTFTDYSGKVRVKFAETPDAWRIHIDGARVYPNAPGASNFKFISDGSKAFLLDEHNRTFTTGTTQDGRVPEREAILPSAYFGRAAYADELRATRIVLTGMAVVSEVECDALDVFYDAQSRRRARIHIGRNDHLIRRIERPIMYAVGGQAKEFNATINISLKNIEINAGLPDSLFSAAKPADYASATFPSARAAVRSLAAAEPAKPGGAPAGMRKVAESTPVQKSGPLQVGSPAPDWTLKNSNDKNVALKDLRGKIVVLDFWATWCGPCKMAMPGVQKISEKYKDKAVRVFGVNCMERNSNVDPMAVIKQKNVTYGQLLNGTTVAAQYGVRAIPSFAVIGKDGNLLYLGAGFNPGAIEQAIESGLGK